MRSKSTNSPVATAARHHRRLVTVALALAVGCALGSGAVLGENFSYHGNLEEAGTPANGSYDLKLTLYSSEQGGQVLAGPIQAYGVAVLDGAFNTNVDFGSTLNLDRTAWLAVEVKAAGGQYEVLADRSPIAPSASACPGSWALDGNNGNPASAYLGNADAKDVLIKSGGKTAARYYPNGAAALSPFSAAPVPGLYSTSVSLSNGAVGDYSFAGGYRGKANFAGSFVWGGDSTSAWSATDSAKNQFIIGAAGGVGINTNAIDNAAALVVSARPAPAGADADFVLQSRNNHKARLYVTDIDGTLVLDLAERMMVIPRMGLGRTPVNHRLEVGGNASKDTAGNWLSNSDVRIKQDIQPIGDALHTLARIKPVTFRYADSYRADHDSIADQRYYNVIAQEFAEVFPDAVQGSGEYLPGAAKTVANEILQVDTYPALITTVAAVQELAAENAALKAQLAALSERLDKLAAKIGR